MEERRVKSKWIVALVDDYSNRIITDNRAGIVINGQKAPIVKKEGYHIFTDIPDTGIWETTGGFYQRKTQSFDGKNELVGVHTIQGINTLQGVSYIRLLPDRSYVTRQSMTILTGNGQKGSKIYLRFINPANPYLILSTDKEWPMVRIYQEEDSFLEGKEFVAENEKERERFQILGRATEEMNTPNGKKASHGKLWVINKCLGASRQSGDDMQKGEKNKKNMKREFCVEVGEKNSFYFLVPEEYASIETVEVEVEGEISHRKFHKGKINVLDLVER